MIARVAGVIALIWCALIPLMAAELLIGFIYLLVLLFAMACDLVFNYLGMWIKKLRS